MVHVITRVGLALALLIGTCLPAVAQGPKDDEEGPSKEVVEAAVERIENALADRKGEAAVRGNALRAETGVVHPDVIAAIAHGLGDKEPLLVDAAIECLGMMRHEDALEALLKWGKRARKELAKENERHVAWAKAVGRHASTESLPALAKDALSQERQVMIARIYAMANVHSIETIEALLDLTKVTDARRVNQTFDPVRIGLMRLTGVDKGSSPQAWQSWWREVKKGYELRPEPALLAKTQQARWDAFWGNERTYERGERRNRRGQDPEDDR